LRGAMDSFNAFPLLDGPDRAFYEAARPNLKIPSKGDGAAIALTAQFGLHPAMAALKDLYSAKHLAIVQACGMSEDSRSHFDAMYAMEVGTPGVRTTANGWLTRHLEGFSDTKDMLIPGLSLGGSLATSLMSSNAVSIANLDDFKIGDSDEDHARMSKAIGSLYRGKTWMDELGRTTLKAIGEVRKLGLQEYKPDASAKYPDHDFGNSLKSIARVLKASLPLRAATVDLGGWDTHQYQGGSEGYFAGLVGVLADGLRAFYNDLAAKNLEKRVTVVVMSEFGRRLAENASYGTDHGHGGAMLVLGGNVNGGKIYGTWPGLANEQLYDRADLAVTTDYRQVVGEILGQRAGNRELQKVFPGFQLGKSLGIVRS
jgi:uncharacterized protein (DUF1501 family)